MEWANGWVESYLEALLSKGLSTEHVGKVNEAMDDVDADKNVYATYYLQQIMGLDEGGLWEAWSKARSSRATGTKDARLQYLSWRVWGMKQKRVKVRAEGRQHLEELPDEVVLVTEPDALEDEAGDGDGDAGRDIGSAVGLMALENRKAAGSLAVNDDVEVRLRPVDDVPLDVTGALKEKEDKLYIVLISMHGLVRGNKMELGRDPDTGGQVKYVVELARALADHPAVHRVDLLTRMIKDPSVDEEYGEPEECIQKGKGKAGGAYIIRMPCGPVTKYIRKEELWPHTREFADNGIQYVETIQASMSELGERCELYVIHGHYADAGEVASLMAQTLGVDMVLTGHSLGRNKLEHLIASSNVSLPAVEKTYNISRRIEGEERALDEAIMVLTSTQQEINQQWGLYNGYDKKLEDVCQRRKGPYHVPAMRVIPPGLDFTNLGAKEGEIDVSEDPPFWEQVFRFLQNPRKPVILAMSRPDTKKNITALVKAFGSKSVLRDLANLVLVMGNRDVIDSMAQGSRIVLEQVLKLIDAYDLYGSVAYPKQHKQSDISSIYCLPARTRGVFVNVALQEPFGLTLIEAGAMGVPIVATKNGGPVDIIHTLQNGILVDPTNTDEIADALLKILTDVPTWDEYSRNGVNNIMAYSWPAHCQKYLASIEREKTRRKNIKQITAFSGSWDNSKFNRMVDHAVGEGKGSPAADANIESMGLSFHDTPKLVDDTVLDFPLEGRMAEEEKDAGVPRIAKREKMFMFALDNHPMAKQALGLLRRAMKSAYGADSDDRETSNVGFGILSMLNYNATCSLLDYESIEIDDLDLIIANGGADVYVWAGQAGQEDMLSYEPYEIHINVNWDKQVVQRLLESIWKDDQKQTRLLKHVRKQTAFGFTPDSGPNHVLKEIEKEVKTRFDDLAVVDRIRARLRSKGVRAQIILQVDKTAAGKGVAPLLHVMPQRASRALAMRFVFERHGVDLENVVLVGVASSISASKTSPDQSESRKVGFVVSDMHDLIGGKQKVVLVPPTDETRVRVPTDRLDEQMIEKLKLYCGPDIYEDRVVLLEEGQTKYTQIAEYLTV